MSHPPRSDIVVFARSFREPGWDGASRNGLAPRGDMGTDFYRVKRGRALNIKNNQTIPKSSFVAVSHDPSVLAISTARGQ
jgi:hypothetical protein